MIEFMTLIFPEIRASIEQRWFTLQVRSKLTTISSSDCPTEIGIKISSHKLDSTALVSKEAMSTRDAYLA